MTIGVPILLDATFQEAVRLWSDALADAGGAGGYGDRLDPISVWIADLAGTTRGDTDGYTIVVDATAAGHGC